MLFAVRVQRARDFYETVRAKKNDRLVHITAADCFRQPKFANRVSYRRALEIENKPVISRL